MGGCVMELEGGCKRLLFRRGSPLVVTEVAYLALDAGEG